MNYAVVILAFVFFISMGYWFIAGKKSYVGPRTHAHVVDGMVVNQPSQSELHDGEKNINTTDGVTHG